jgi:hypothetical protein
MPEAVRYRNKGTQSGAGMLRYRTKICTGCRNADACGIDLDADAQPICYLLAHFAAYTTYRMSPPPPVANSSSINTG